MKSFCPNCLTERELATIDTVEKIEVRGEEIEVPVHYLKCSTCGNQSNDPDSEYDELDAAYREFRKRHGLLQPEEIRTFRKGAGLSQLELASLLGWGAVTLSRYENGALQSKSHDEALRSIMDPAALLRKLQVSRASLAPKRWQSAIDRLEQEVSARTPSLRAVIEESRTRNRPDEYSGHRQFDLEKMFQAILFFCQEPGVTATKLCKLLFYADFAHFRDQGVSITGTRYAHLPYGPVPDGYDAVYAALGEDGMIEREEVPCGRWVTELLVARQVPVLGVFTASESRVLEATRTRFADYTAKRMTDLSHREEGYKATQRGELISYKYARTLRV